MYGPFRICRTKSFNMRRIKLGLQITQDKWKKNEAIRKLHMNLGWNRLNLLRNFHAAFHNWENG